MLSVHLFDSLNVSTYSGEELNVYYIRVTSRIHCDALSLVLSSN